MIHYSCDRCKRSIDSLDELRYVVKLEIIAAIEPAEVDDERDHLMEVHEILEKLDDVDVLNDEGRQQKRFDLCPECYQQFIKNPIGRDVAAQLGFSSN
jgi:hypothetical protein